MQPHHDLRGPAGEPVSEQDPQVGPEEPESLQHLSARGIAARPHFESRHGFDYSGAPSRGHGFSILRRQSPGAADTTFPPPLAGHEKAAENTGKKPKKRHELAEWLQREQPALIGVEQFSSIGQRWRPYRRATCARLRDSGVDLAPMVEGVRQANFDELESSLLALTTVI